MKNKKINLFDIVPIKKLDYIILIALSFISALFGAVIPMYLKNIIDTLSNNFTFKDIILPLSLLLFQTFLMTVANYFMRYIGNKSMLEIRDVIWGKLLKLPLSFFDKNSSGKLISKFFNNVTIVNIFLVSDFPTLFSKFLIIIFSIVMLFYINSKFLILVFMILLISFGVFSFLGKFSFTLSKEIQKEIASLTSKLDENINLIKQIKASHTENHERSEGYKYSKSIYLLSMKEAAINSITDPIFSFIIFISIFVVFTYSGIEVANHRMTIGSLIASIFYMFQICSPLIGISSTFLNYNKAKGAAVEIVDILDTSEEQIAGLKVKDTSKNIIQFKDVTFNYEEDKKILNNVSFEIKQGINALIGPSGSGKSTIFNLIERFYPLTDGKILYGEIDIKEYNLHEWRKLIGFVPQEPIIFDDTLRNNIFYGVEEKCSDDDLKHLLKKYEAFDFIFDKNYSLDYLVGSYGKKLSGGQKQLISIARLILNNKKIILLDEITANLDSNSEKIIKDLIFNLGKDKIVFIIAHRLTTVANASNILFLDNGFITGSGTHESLYLTHKKYKDFYKNQILK